MQSEPSSSSVQRVSAWTGPGVRSLVFRAGGLAVLRAIRSGGPQIIAYHRFPADCTELLDCQCRYLRSHHQIVSLRQIDAWLYDDIPLPRGAIAVTVDDGHRDFYRVAYPVFRKYRIPVTVFLTTGFLDRVCWLWTDAVVYLIFRSPLEQVEIPLGAGAREFALRCEQEKAIAVSAVKQAYKRLDDDLRRTLLSRLPELLQVDLPKTPPPEYEAMTWDEVREVHAQGIAFGGHTQTHPVLSSIQEEACLASEIAGSKRRIEAELGAPAFHFAYPNGTSQDFNAAVVRQVRRAGYSSAFLAEPGVNRKSTDHFALYRVPVEPTTPMPFFGRAVLRSR